MLVLSRKVGERILLPDSNVVVTVVAVKGNRVRLGVSAPADVAVYREELWCQTGRERAACRKRVSEDAGGTGASRWEASRTPVPAPH
jgi:carbon storage regulator